MIDSVLLRYEMGPEEATELINSFSIKIPASKSKIEKFCQPRNLSVYYLPKCKRKEMDKVSPALLSVRFYKHSEVYFFELGIRLEVLLQGKETIRLFVSDQLNIQMLQEAYALMMVKLAPEAVKKHNIFYKYDKEYHEFIATDADLNKWSALSRLPYLALATVLRVDYTINLKVPDKDIYLELARKSFREIKGQHLRRFDNNNVSSTSRTRNVTITITGKEHVTYSKGSYAKVTLYDKQEKYIDMHCNDQELLDASANVIRYEVSLNNIHRWKPERYCDKLRIRIPKLCGFLPWLDETVAHDILRYYYDTHIGSGRFLNQYQFEKIIDAADYGYQKKKAEENYKQELKDLSLLISRVQSVQKAQELYIKGTTVGKPPREIRGTIEKFNKMLADIHDAGAMPLRLPKTGATAGMKEFVNPIIQNDNGGHPELNGYLYSHNRIGEFYPIDDSHLHNLLTLPANIDLFAMVNDFNKSREVPEPFIDSKVKYIREEYEPEPDYEDMALDRKAEQLMAELD